MNSDLIELADNKAVVVRVNEYKAAALKPLSDVSEQIKADLMTQKSQDLAKQFVQTIATKLDNNESVDAELAEKSLAFSADLTFARYTREYDYQVIQQLFKLEKPAQGEVSRQWVTTSTGDYAVIELSKVVDVATADEQATAQLETMLARSASDETYQALIAQLIANADIQYSVAE